MSQDARSPAASPMSRPHNNHCTHVPSPTSRQHCCYLALLDRNVPHPNVFAMTRPSLHHRNFLTGRLFPLQKPFDRSRVQLLKRFTTFYKSRATSHVPREDTDLLAIFWMLIYTMSLLKNAYTLRISPLASSIEILSRLKI